jgi:hypothetical protein
MWKEKKREKKMQNDKEAEPTKERAVSHHLQLTTSKTLFFILQNETRGIDMTTNAYIELNCV